MKSVKQLRAWLETSPFARMIKDAEVKPLWEKGTELAQQYNGMAEKAVGVSPLGLLDRIQGEAMIAMTGLKIADPPTAGIAFAIDCGDAKEAFAKDLDTLLAQVPEKAYRSSERTVEGVSIRVFSPVSSEDDQGRRRRRRGPAVLGPIHMAWVGSVLFLSNDKSAIDSYVQSGSQEQSSTLGDTANWRDTMDKLGGSGDMTLYVNINAISELLEAFSGMNEDAAPIIAALGLDQFPALGSSSFFKDEALTGRAVLRYTGDRKSGLGSLLQLKKADLSVPRWVPENAWQVTIFNYDVTGAFDGMMGMMKEAGEEPAADIEEGLEEFRNKFGMSLRDDFLSAFGNPVVLVRMPPPANALDSDERNMGMVFRPFGGAPMLLGVKVRNRQILEQFIEYFEGMGSSVTEYLGATIMTGPTFDGVNPVFEFAITDTHILYSMGGGNMIRQVLQSMGGQSRGFGGQEGVRDAVKELPREGAALIVYNYGRALATGLNFLKLATRMTERVDILAKLSIPSAAVLEKYLGFAATVVAFEPGTGIVADTTFRMRK